MKRALCTLAMALLLVVVHATLRAMGLAAHASAAAGMPIDPWSLPIAVVYVGAYLGAIVLTPILAMASVGEAALAALGARRASPPEG